MPGFNAAPAFVASGNINPSVFVKLDTSNNFSVLQAGANARTIGITSEGTKYAPGTNSNTYNAVQGDEVTVYGLGDVCLLTIGSGGCTVGDLLESDANGAGVTSTTSGHAVGAVALETRAYNEKARVQIVFMNHA